MQLSLHLECAHACVRRCADVPLCVTAGCLSAYRLSGRQTAAAECLPSAQEEACMQHHYKEAELQGIWGPVVGHVSEVPHQLAIPICPVKHMLCSLHVQTSTMVAVLSLYDFILPHTAFHDSSMKRPSHRIWLSRGSSLSAQLRLYCVAASAHMMCCCPADVHSQVLGSLGSRQ